MLVPRQVILFSVLFGAAGIAPDDCWVRPFSAVRTAPAGALPPHKVMRPLRPGLVTVVHQVGPRELPPKRWPDGTGLAS